MRVPRPLRELLGLVPVARVRREVALGDVAGERAQRLLVLGLGERVGALGSATGRGVSADRPTNLTTVSGNARTDVPAAGDRA